MADQENRRLGRILKMSVHDVRALEGAVPSVNGAESQADPKTEKSAQEASDTPSTYDLSG